jgi:hypothetical protein
MLLLGPGKLRILFTLPAVQYFMHCARFWHLVLCLLQEMSNRSRQTNRLEGQWEGDK